MTGHTNNWTPLFTNKGGQFVRNVDFLTKYEYIKLEGKITEYKYENIQKQ